MKDKHEREIDYMRISITEKCNYRCFYCMPQSVEVNDVNEEKLDAKQIIELAKIGANLGIKKVRITGGEPLIRSDIDEVLRGIANIEGIKELCLTTNGSMLESKIALLKECKVNRINVSLDTLKSERFKKITKYGNFETVWNGIEAALDAKIEIRINSVIIKGINEDEIINLAMLVQKYPIDVRFIELMPIGEGKRHKGITGKEIKEKLNELGELKKIVKREGAAEYYTVTGGKGKIGFINPMSNCFCAECNRIRITSKGMVKQCLNKKSSLNIKKILDAKENEKKIEEILAKEIFNKPEKHLFNNLNKFEENANMNQIGG